jgi:hypothetical protein
MAKRINSLVGQVMRSRLTPGSMRLNWRDFVKKRTVIVSDKTIQRRLLLRQLIVGPRCRAVTPLPAARAHYQLAQQQAPLNGFVANNYGAFLCALRQYGESAKKRTVIVSDKTIQRRLLLRQLIVGPRCRAVTPHRSGVTARQRGPTINWRSSRRR